MWYIYGIYKHIDYMYIYIPCINTYHIAMYFYICIYPQIIFYINFISDSKRELENTDQRGCWVCWSCTIKLYRGIHLEILFWHHDQKIARYWDLRQKAKLMRAWTQKTFFSCFIQWIGNLDRFYLNKECHC